VHGKTKFHSENTLCWLEFEQLTAPEGQRWLHKQDLLALQELMSPFTSWCLELLCLGSQKNVREFKGKITKPKCPAGATVCLILHNAHNPFWPPVFLQMRKQHSYSGQQQTLRMHTTKWAWHWQLHKSCRNIYFNSIFEGQKWHIWVNPLVWNNLC
jgi:hypothetical protein